MNITTQSARHYMPTLLVYEYYHVLFVVNQGKSPPFNLTLFLNASHAKLHREGTSKSDHLAQTYAMNAHSC